MASKIITKMQDKAERLWEIRHEIYEIEELSKIRLDQLKAIRDSVQDELLADMNKNGLVSLKVKSGDSFYKGSKQSIEITNEVLALKWARDNNAYSINKIMVAQKLKDLTEVPNGFKVEMRDFISVRKAKKDEN